jgi:hypothetical protein
MAIVYVGKVYTTEVSSKAIKQVTCDKCGCQYAYVMLRRATGRGHSPYMLNNQGAADKATQRAQARLEAQMQSCDPVECPDCGWFSLEMVNAAKAKDWPWTPWGAGTGLDPNALWPEQRGHFPGRPTPIRIRPGRRPGKPPQHLLPPEIEPDGAITIHPERDALPNVCCNCLAPTDERALMQFTRMRIPPLHYPVCRSCGFKYNLIERTGMTITILLGMALTTMLFYPLFTGSVEAQRDPTMPVIMACALGLTVGAAVGGLLWLLVKKVMPAAVKLSAYDDPRNLYRVRFASPEFAEQVRQATAKVPLPRPAGQHAMAR